MRDDFEGEGLRGREAGESGVSLRRGERVEEMSQRKRKEQKLRRGSIEG